MSTTPRLAMPYILTQQAQKEVTHAAGLKRLDALVQPVVQQIGLNTPPASPADGQCWIIGAVPTGVWAGQANRLTQRIGGAWVFYAPFVGLVVFDAAKLAQWGWSGSAWTLVAPRLLQASITYDPPRLAAGEGVTTTVDVPGAAFGDFARASFSLDLQGITLPAWVSAADTVSVRLQNGTADAVDLGGGTLRVRMEKP
ncbi:DUF2793 domain-containing protein [Falsiroseomonas sp.]|uniref:DUF2793 domain-containing protein n=1 Tax=Falsiroseomonas sp. TaxID=2870721 RepID=UPI0035616941